MIAPADNVVNEDVFSPDNDVVHSWWAPELGGKIDAIPGRTNHTWFQARPAPTPPAAPSSAASSTRRCRRWSASCRAPSTSSSSTSARRIRPLELGQEEYQHVCAVCHKLNEAYVGPALGTNPLLTDAKDLTTILRQGVGNMPAVGSDWSDDQITALVNYTKTLVQKAAMATSSAKFLLSPTAPDWRQGGVVSWLTTVDHKRIGILYIWTALCSSRSAASSRW